MQTQETTDGADRATPLVAMVTGGELAMIQAGAGMAGVATGEWMRPAAPDAARAPVGGADRALSVLYAVLFDLDWQAQCSRRSTGSVGMHRRRRTTSWTVRSRGRRN